MGETKTTNDELKNLILTLTSKVDDFEKIGTETRKEVEKNTEDITKLKQESKETKENMEKELKQVKKDIDILYNSSRMKNLVFYGINDSEEINKGLYKHVLKILRDVNIDERIVDHIKRIGAIKGSRPVVVTLMSQKYKKDIYDKADQLKSLYKITIANDLSKTERDEFNKLRKVRDELKLLNFDAKIYRNKIQIKDKMYDFESANELMCKIKVKEQEKSEIKDSQDTDISVHNGNLEAIRTKKRAANFSPNQIANNPKKIKDKQEFYNNRRHIEKNIQ